MCYCQVTCFPPAGTRSPLQTYSFFQCLIGNMCCKSTPPSFVFDFLFVYMVVFVGTRKKVFFFALSPITGQNGVHLVREISPWSSQVLCIGLAQNLKPILSDDKYWNINPNISAFGMWLICDNTWMYNIQAYAWMYHIQAFAWPQIWPNPIPNPIHGCNTFKIFEHMYALKYQQIWPNPISNPIHGLAIIKF